MKKQTTCLIVFVLLLPLSLITLAQNNSKLVKLTTEAEIIFTGKVIDQSHSWNEEKSRIYTDVAIRVDEYLKGEESKETIIIRHLGGEVDGVGEFYSHMPRFQDNEEVLLFAKRDLKRANYKVLKGEEGKLTIYTDEKTGKKLSSLNIEMSSLKRQIRSHVKQ